MAISAFGVRNLQAFPGAFTTGVIPGPLIIGGPVDPTSLFGVNADTGPAISTGENPAISFVGAPATIFRIVWDTFAQQTGLIFRRADGSRGAEAALVQGDVILNMTARGFRGDRYTTGSEGSGTFEIWAAENWSPTAAGGLITWRTMTVGQSGAANSLYRMALYQGLAIAAPASNTPLAFVDPGPGSLSVQNNVIVGFTSLIAATAAPVTPTMQLHGTTANTAAFSQTRWSNDANAPQNYFLKSRGASINSRSQVLINDALGNLIWGGDDGLNFTTAARILCNVDNTASVGVVPGRIVISTANASGVLTEVVRFDSTQTAIFANILRINQTPTVNISASTTITNGADSATNLGHRISFNLNGTTYWIPCGATAF